MKSKSPSILISVSLLLLGTFMAGAQSVFFQAVTNLNPAAYWPLQETTPPPTAQIETNLGSLGTAANAYYSSTNAIPGIAGVTAPQDSDTAISFAGNRSGAFLAVPMTNGVSVPVGPFSVEAWVYPTNINSAANTIVSQTGPYGTGGLNGGPNSGGWSLNQNYIPSQNRNNSLLGWTFHVFNGVGGAGGAEVVVPCAIIVNNWYHLVGIYDGTNAYLYVDGTNASAEGYQTPMTGSYVQDTWTPLTIGCGRGFNNNQYYGGIDEVAVYTYELSANQISNHYYAALNAPGYATVITGDSPSMYWRMDAPAYTAPATSAYPVANNYGTAGNLTGLYLSGTTPGVTGPADPGLGSPSYACAFNGIGTSATNSTPLFTNNLVAGTTRILLNSGVVITNLPTAVMNLRSNNITAMCWFKANPADDRFQGLFGHSDSSWRLALDGTTGRVHWNPGEGGELTSAGLYNDGNWHFAVGVYANGGTAATGTNLLYVDGVLDTSTTLTNIATGSTTDVQLGGSPDYTGSGNNSSYNNRFFSGSLAHCAYFTNALTAAQVLNLYTNATGGVLPTTPPFITAQPYPYPSVRQVAGGAGQYIFEAVIASGTPPVAYQWYYNTSSNYAGATALQDNVVNFTNSQTSQVTITNLASGNSGYYFCVVSDSFGSSTSAIVNVQVVTLPVITAQSPSGAFSLYPNQNDTLSVTALGATPLTYQWYTNGVADTSAGTGSSYSAQAAMSGETYQCVVTNIYGAVTNTLDTLTVNPLPTSITASAYSTNILALNPSGYWPLHETATAPIGDVETNYGSLGSAGNGYYMDWATPLVTHDSPGALAGSSDGAVTFYNTNNDALLIPHTSPGTTLQAPLSLEAWIKPLANNSGIGSYMVIMGQGGATGLNGGAGRGGFALQYSGTPNTFSLVVWTNNSNGNSYEQKTVAAYPPGQWYHLVCTYDGTNVEYYINGVEAGYLPGNPTGFPSTMVPDYWSPLTIGAGRWGTAGTAQPFIGQIDEVAVYTNVLSTTQIGNHYNAGITASSNYFQTVIGDSPLLYYRMDAPAYTLPPSSTWPAVTNYGSVAVNGVYSPGTMPGAATGPNESGQTAANFSANNAMLGNGVSSYADVGIAPQLNPIFFTNFSYTAWFRGLPADDRSFKGIMSANDNTWRSSINSSGQIQAHGNADISGALAYNDGNWHQYVVTAQGAVTNVASFLGNFTNNLYVDGQLVKTSVNAGTNSPFATSQPSPEVLIGDETGYTNSAASGAGRSMAGAICEAAFFYGTVLNSNQVRSLYDAAGVPPFITTQPVSGTVNENAGFTNVMAVGGSDTLVYQWYHNSSSNYAGATAVVNNARISGAANTGLTNSSVQPSDAGYYFVLVTNGYGSATSSIVSLTVNSTPSITNETPVIYTSSNELFAGSSPVFTVAAVGATPLYYQWYTNNVPVTGATNTTFVMGNVQGTAITNYCVVTNFVGSTTSAVWAASVLATNGLSNYPLAVLALNPAGYWRLNEPDDGSFDGNPGAIAHDYAGGNNGIYTNTYLGQTGYSTADLETSAEFGYLSSANSAAIGIQAPDFALPNGSNAEFTIEAWVNPYEQVETTEPGNAGIATKGYFYGEEYDLDCGAPGNCFRFEIRDAAGTVFNANSTVGTNNVNNQWFHLVGVCDEVNSNISFYVNGALVSTVAVPAASGITNSATTPMFIGGRASNPTSGINNQFLGFINDVAVFHYAMTASQVANEYAEAGDLPPALIQAPPTNETAVAGSTFTVPAVAAGSPSLGYYWTDTGNGTNLTSGYTNGVLLNAGLTISNLPAGLNGDQLELTVSNAFGSTNAFVNLSITSMPEITNSLPSQLTLVTGRAYTYSIGALGTPPLSYQWYEGATAIAGQTGATYTLTTGSPGSEQYSVVVTNVYGAATSSVSVLTTVASYHSEILSNSPVVYWPLNEAPVNNGTGNPNVIAYDIVGGHNATYTNTLLGAPGYSASDPDTAAEFGVYTTNSYAQEIDLSGNGVANIDFAQPSGNNAEFSVEAWANATANQTLNDRIVDKGHFFDEEFALDLGTTVPSTAFRFTLRNAAGTEYDARSAVVPDGHWHHLVGICDEANGLIELYVDGVLAATNYNGSGPAPQSGLFEDTELMSIGNADTSSVGAGTYYAQFIGSIGEVALYNYPLTASQVLADYQAATAGTVTINPNPTNIVFAVSGNQLTLSWPSDHTGWQLQAQTNALSVGLNTNWVNVAGSTTTNELVMPISPANGSVFYRLIYQ